MTYRRPLSLVVGVIGAHRKALLAVDEQRTPGTEGHPDGCEVDPADRTDLHAGVGSL